jgi:hypothetical protein
MRHLPNSGLRAQEPASVPVSEVPDVAFPNRLPRSESNLKFLIFLPSFAALI